MPIARFCESKALAKLSRKSPRQSAESRISLRRGKVKDSGASGNPWGAPTAQRRWPPSPAWFGSSCPDRRRSGTATASMAWAMGAEGGKDSTSGRQGGCSPKLGELPFKEMVVRKYQEATSHKQLVPYFVNREPPRHQKRASSSSGRKFTKP